MQINIKSNLEEIMRRIPAVYQKQLPFAASQALNDAVFEARNHIINKTYPESFKQKNRTFARAMFRVGKATKNKLTANLFDALDRANMKLHTEGGIKSPASGGNIAVPSQEVKRLNNGHGVPQEFKPRNIINDKKAFKLRLAGGQQVIAQRVGSKRNPLRILYGLEPSVKLEQSFPFYKEAERIALKVFSLKVFDRLRVAYQNRK